MGHYDDCYEREYEKTRSCSYEQTETRILEAKKEIYKKFYKAIQSLKQNPGSTITVDVDKLTITVEYPKVEHY